MMQPYRYVLLFIMACLLSSATGSASGWVHHAGLFSSEINGTPASPYVDLQECYFSVDWLLGSSNDNCPLSTNNNVFAIPNPGPVSNYEYNWGGGFQADNQAPSLLGNDVNLTARERNTGIEVNFVFLKTSFVRGGIKANPACTSGGLGRIRVGPFTSCGQVSITLSRDGDVIATSDNLMVEDVPPGRYSISLTVVTNAEPPIEITDFLGSTFSYITVGEAVVSNAVSDGGSNARPTGPAAQRQTCSSQTQITTLTDQIAAFSRVACSDGGTIQYQWYQSESTNNYDNASPVPGPEGRQEFYTPTANSDGIQLLRQARCTGDPASGGIWHATDFVTYADLQPIITGSSVEPTRGETVTLLVTDLGTTAAGVPIDYVWLGGSSQGVGGSTTRTVTFSPTATAEYEVQVTQGNCTATSPGVTVNVNQPDATDDDCKFPLAFNATTVNSDRTERFFAVASAGNDGPHTYQWTVPPSSYINPNAAEQSVSSGIVGSLGTYAVRVTDADGDYTDGVYYFGRSSSGPAFVQPEKCPGAGDGVISFGPFVTYPAIGSTLPDLDRSVTITVLDENNNVLITRTTSSTPVDDDLGGTGVLTGLPPSTYTLRIEPAGGVVATQNLIVNPAPTGEIDLPTVQLPNCDRPNGSLTLAYREGITDRTGETTFSIVRQGDPASLQIGGPTFSGLGTGTYTITANLGEAECNCVTTREYTLNALIPAEPLTVDPVITNVSCDNANNGTVDLNPAGGAGNYTVTGDLTSTVTTGLGPGDYAYTLTDEGQCYTVSAEVAVGIDAPTLIISCNSQNVSTVGGNDGQIFGTVTGGNPPYTIALSNGDVSADLGNDFRFPGLTANPNPYTVTVTDATGCTVICRQTVSEPDCSTFNIIQLIEASDPTCNRSSDGRIVVGTTRGTPPYEATWTGPGASGTGLIQSSLPGGTYTVFITDSDGCVSPIETIVLTEPEPLNVTAEVQNVLCRGAATGSITLNITGEAGAYSVEWNDDTGAGAGAVRSGLTAGSYTAVIRSGICPAISRTFVITEPDAPFEVSAQLLTGVSCFGEADATVAISASNGSGDVNYILNGLPISGPLLTLGAGTYELAGTDQGPNGCSDTTSFIIPDPLPFNVACESTNNTTVGGTEGTLTLTFSLGTPPYRYQINDGPVDSTFDSTVQRFGLPAGQYNVTARNGNGCADTCRTEITQPNCFPSVVLADPQLVDPTCFGGSNGSLILGASGQGAIIYTFNGDTVPGGLIEGLTAGDYVVSATDERGCQALTTFTLTDPDAIEITCTPTATQTVNQNDGSITIDVLNGQAEYTVSLNGTPTGDAYLVTPFTVAGLTPADYAIVVRDGSGCETTCSTTVDSLVCPTLTAILGPTPPSCAGGNDGRIQISVLDLITDYEFFYENAPVTDNQVTGLSAGTYLITARNPAGCDTTFTTTIADPEAFTVSCIGSTTSQIAAADGDIQVILANGAPPFTLRIGGVAYPNVQATDTTFSGYTAGDYSVIALSSEGCQDTCVATVADPTCTGISLTVTSTDVSCSGASDGQLLITTTGGTAPLTVKVNDTTQPSNELTGLPPGTYTVVVTDALNCSTSQTVLLTQPDEFTITCVATPVTTVGGMDGSIVVTRMNGAGPVFYSESGGLSITSDLPQVQLGPFAAGEYLITAVDTAGCQASCTTVVDTVSCRPLGFQFEVGPPTCGGASDAFIVALPLSTASDLTFRLLDDGAAGIPREFTDTLFGVSAGVYTLEAQAPNGCTERQRVTVNDAPEFTVTFSSSDVTTNMGTDGAITLSFATGQGDYTVVFDGEPDFTTSEAMVTYAGLNARDYAYAVTNRFGCTVTGTISVSEPGCTPILLNELLANPTCNGATDGEIRLMPSGTSDLGPYQLSVTGPGTNSTELVTENLGAGQYIIAITDAAGCSFNDTLELADPEPLTITVTPGELDAVGGSTSVNVSINNGASPFTIFRSATDSILTDLRSIDLPGYGQGMDTIRVVDTNDCEDRQSFTINPFSCPAVNIDLVAAAPDCPGGNDGTIIVITDATAEQLTFTANGVDFPGTTFTSASAQFYTIEGADARGCVYSDTITVPETTTPFQLTCSATPIVGQGSSNGTVQLTFTDGIGPYEVVLSTGDGTRQFTSTGDTLLTDLGPGTYELSVTDGNGCQSECLATINDQDCPEPEIAVTTTAPDCLGGNNGTLRVVATGGNGGFTYRHAGPDTIIPNGFLTGLTAGAYTIAVTDAFGCTFVTNSTVDSTQTPLTLRCSGTPITAVDLSDGMIALEFTNGEPNYTIELLDESMAFVRRVIATRDTTLSDLAVGLYTAIVSDARRCQTSCTPIINDINCIPIVLGLTPAAPNCVDGQDGFIAIEAEGGTGELRYSFNGNLISGDTLFGLTGGTEYLLTAIDVKGCSVEESVLVPEALPFTAAANAADVSSVGGSDGSVVLTFTNGSAPYTLIFPDSTYTADADLTTVSGLPANDNYEVLITDANGCTTTVTFGISEPGCGNFTLDVQPSNPTCGDPGGGNILVSPVGGQAPYRYSFDDSLTFTDVNLLSGATSGSYQIVVIDGQGCVARSTVDLVDPIPISFSTRTDSADVDMANGAIFVSNIVGGNPVGNYILQIDGQRVGNRIVSGGTYRFPGYAAGSYTVVLNDGNGCADTVLTTVFEREPEVDVCADFSTDPASEPSTCGSANGLISLNVSGGSGARTVLWGDDSTIVTEERTSLPGGTYFYTVTDVAGCNLSGIVDVSESAAFDLRFEQQPGSCTTPAEITVIPSVGGDFEYAWSTGETTASITSDQAGRFVGITVTDADGCVQADSTEVLATIPFTATVTLGEDNLCPGETTSAIVDLNNDPTVPISDFTFAWSVRDGTTGAFITGVPVGDDYFVTVTNGTDCSRVVPFSVTGSPEIVPGQPVITDIACGEPGAISVFAAGGTGELTYEWNNGVVGNSLTGLTQAGEYTVTITDASDCATTRTYSVAQAADLSITVTTEPGSCDGALPMATVSPAGGSGNVRVEWSNGDTALTTTFLEAGTYGVTVTDESGCTPAEDEVTVTALSFPANVVLVEEIEPANCNLPGGISLNPSPTFSYVWDLPGSPTSPNQPALAGGTYSVTVSAAGCDSLLSIFLPTTGAAFSIDALTTTALLDCSDSRNGELGVSTQDADAASGQLTYTWNDGSTARFRSNLAAGTYSVTATDEAGCSQTDAVNITAPAPITFRCPAADSIEQGQSNGEIPLAIAGGTGNYDVRYSGSVDGTLNDVGGAALISGLPAGTYAIEVRDDNDCIAAAPCSVTIRELDNSCTTTLESLGVSISASATSGCDGASGTIRFLGDVPGLAYSIDGEAPLDTSGVFEGLVAGTYFPVVRNLDGAGCAVRAIDSIVITAAVNPVVDVNVVSPSGCNAENGSITFTEVVAAGRLEYSIDGGVGFEDDRTFTGLSGGNYVVRARRTDGSGCPFEFMDTVVLAAPAQPILTGVVVEPSTDCDVANGQVSINVSGATPSTQYRLDSGAWRSSPIIGGLAGGTYTIEIRDSISGCTDRPDSLVVVSGARPIPDFAVIVRDATSCEPPNGSVIIDLLGADDSAYEFSITGGSTFQGSPEFTDLSPISGNVVIRNRGGVGECIESISYSVDGAGLSVAVDSIATTNRSCNANNGSIQIFTPTENQRYSLDGGLTWETDSIITGLSDGRYTLTVGSTNPDNNCTVDLAERIVIDPTNIRIDAERTRVDPCRDTGPANIELEVSGGDGEYSYLWNDNDTSATRLNLAAGTYTVTVVDGFDCRVEETYVVLESIRDSLLAAIPDTSACQGDTVTFDLRNFSDDNLFSWRDASNVFVPGPVLNATVTGDYVLQGRLEGCIEPVREIFRVDFVEPDRYVADFNLPNYGFVGENIYVRDASSPPADSATYLFEEEFTTNLGSSQVSQGLSFSRVGEYTIEMEAFSGACYATTSRVITIIEPTSNLDTNAVVSTDLFQELVLYPNPHDGDFNVKGTAMQDLDEVRFRCYDDVGRIQFETTYNIPAGLFDVDIDARAVLPSGMQTIVIEAKSEEIIIRHYRAER